MAELIEVLDESTGEIECFLDPDNEVFFGPITEKEREVRKPLPRRTLHPCEITEISRRGMNFHEWEEFKEHVQRNQLNDEAIYEVFGKDDTTGSFASCCTSGDDELKTREAAVPSDTDDTSSNQSHYEITNDSNLNEISGVESLNDTWEIQERMLAYAERLERGEDIPELGICNSLSKTEDSIRREGVATAFETEGTCIEKENHHMFPDMSTDSWIMVKGRKETTDDPEEEKENMKCEVPSEISHGQSMAATFIIKKEPKKKSPMKSTCQLVKNMEALTFVVQPTFPNSPAKCKSASVTRPVKAFTPSRIPLCETPVKTPRAANHRMIVTPTQPNSSSKSGSSIKQTSCMKQNQHYGTPSPVGLYIRSLPEPILIENIRSSQKKKQITNVRCDAPTLVAVKKEDGRWGTAERLAKTSCPPPQPTPIPEDYKPVLPVVLHEAAATIINETPSTTSLPGTTGKIGQLLKRGVTPTVLKHQGRIQLPNSASKPSRIMEPPKSVKNERTRLDLMEVSVLETISTPTSYRPVRLVKSARK